MQLLTLNSLIKTEKINENLLIGFFFLCRQQFETQTQTHWITKAADGFALLLSEFIVLLAADWTHLNYNLKRSVTEDQTEDQITSRHASCFMLFWPKLLECNCWNHNILCSFCRKQLIRMQKSNEELNQLLETQHWVEKRLTHRHPAAHCIWQHTHWQSDGGLPPFHHDQRLIPGKASCGKNIIDGYQNRRIL